MLSEAKIKKITMVHNVTETNLRSVIEDHFQNYVLLRKVEQDMKTVFLNFTEEVMFLEVSNKSNNNQSKLKT